ncbi:hypothetical protein ACQKKK_21560 [Peribacillus sp. NPDC006672]
MKIRFPNTEGFFLFGGTFTGKNNGAPWLGLTKWFSLHKKQGD